MPIFHVNGLEPYTLWGIDQGFYLSMLVVLIIVIIQNLVFWNIKRKQVFATDFINAIKKDANLELVKKTFENNSEKHLLNRHADICIEEALRNQTHEEVLCYLLQNLPYSESVTKNRKYLLLALDNPNTDITRCYLELCERK